MTRNWFKKYTVENTVMIGKVARVYIGGHEVKGAFEAFVFGPLVLAWSYMRCTKHELIVHFVGKKLAPRMHFGFGKVVLSDH